jgi:hypothetical protein
MTSGDAVVDGSVSWLPFLHTSGGDSFSPVSGDSREGLKARHRNADGFFR